MKSQSPRERATQAFQRAVTKARINARERATVGWRKSETNVIFAVPGRKNYLYVTKSDQTVTQALNRAGVPHTAFLPVFLELENNTYVIVARDNSSAATLVNVPDSAYGVPSHPLTSHSDIAADSSPSAGTVPIYNETTGKWEFGIIPVPAVLDDLDDVTIIGPFDGDLLVADGGVFYNTDQIPDAMAATIDAATELTTPSSTHRFPVTVAGSLRYITWANIIAHAVADDAITNAKLANMAEGTVKGRASGAGTGDPTDLTGAQVAAIVQATHDSRYVMLTTNQTVAGIKRFADNMTIGSNNAPAATLHIRKPSAGMLVDSIDGTAGATGSASIQIRNDAGVFGVINVGRSGLSGKGSNLNIESDAQIRFYANDRNTLRGLIDLDGDLVFSVLRALGSAGVRIEDDAGNLAILVNDGGTLQLARIVTGVEILTNSAGQTLLVGSNALENSGTTRRARIGAHHFDLGEEPLTIFHSVSSASDNQIIIGGGSSIMNAATIIDFNLAANATTVTGTRRFRFTPDGMEITNKLGIGIAPSTVGASKLGLQAGTSNNDAAVGGVLYSTYTAVGNVGTGEDDLVSYSVPANTLNADGMALRFRAWGTFGGTSEAKAIRVRFGTSGTNLVYELDQLEGSSGNWSVEGVIARTGAATQKSIAWRNGSIMQQNLSLNQTLSGAVTFKVTAECASTTNGVILQGCILEWLDANT